jgi:DNA-binding transcriptional ArsR family regulator
VRNQLFHPARDDISMDKVLHALSDPIRRDIARRMHVDGPRVCGQLSYPIAKSTLSHHLKVLRESGLMHTEIRGTSRIVSLRRADIDARFPLLLDAVQVTSVPAAQAVA